MNLSLRVKERTLKQNSFKLSSESHNVRYFSNVMWETVPRRRSCIGEASLTEFNTCPWSLIFAGTGRAQTSTGLQICCGSDCISKVGKCSFCILCTSRQSLKVIQYYLVYTVDSLHTP